jgi:glucose/arabinose dehydrogenase
MKRVIFLVTLCAALLLIALFAWKNFRGIGPAVRKPPQDIADLIRRDPNGPPLRLAPGFSLSVFARDLGKPRVLVLDRNGTLLVSIPSSGTILALPDRDRDGAADGPVTVAQGLNRPHGLAFRCAPDCKLYVAQEDRVDVFAYNGETMKATREKKLIDLPAGGFHVTRTLLFPPSPGQGRLLVSVGSSCNVCVEEDRRRAAILSIPAEGGEASVFAGGLRNAVFLAANPRTGGVWATEMGRDMLGDDLPPDEINIIRQDGNYGWPYCYGRNVHDGDFDPGNAHSCSGTIPSHIDIPAHSAPLGLAFFPETGWPPEFAQDLLVAYHGSWNRSEPTGYKIVRFRLDESGTCLGREDFVTGWLRGGTALGRPVDILIGPDRTIFVSDDKAGVIYRITYRQTAS